MKKEDIRTETDFDIFVEELELKNLPHDVEYEEYNKALEILYGHPAFEKDIEKGDYGMTKEILNKIKEFAEYNMNCDDEDQFVVEAKDVALTNPWIDYSARFTLTDEEAVKEWGLEIVLEFCEKAKAYIKL